MKQHVFNKYLSIKQDLYSNLKKVFNRQHYYTHKYRGNEFTDINVAIDITPERNKMVQIFVRHKDYWIKDRVEFNSQGIVSIDIKKNFEI